MGAVLSWLAVRLCALVLDTADALRRWRPQEALERSPHLPEGLGLEDGDLGIDSLEWCERSLGGGDTSDEYFDSRSWHSDTLSDLTTDGEDCLDVLLGLEDAYDGHRATGSSFHTGQSKARRRESAKDNHRDATETYVEQTSCSRRKSPENHLDPDIPIKLGTRDLCPVEIRPHPTSSSFDELEDAHFALSDRNANLDKVIKRSKTKCSQTGNRGSKFSVFAKMPSFRKAKGSKGAKSEEVPQESSDGGGEGLMPEQGSQKDNSDDEVFVKGDILNQTVHQTFSPARYEIEEEECGFFPSTPHTRHVRHLVNQGSSEDSSPDNPRLRQVQSPNGQTYKRSKSNDSLNIRMRFAQAHKSLSSLFESRLMDKENEEQATAGIDVNSGKAKQSWKKLKKAKEAELLKRTLSVPDGDCCNASGQDRGHFSSSPLLDRLSNPGSPSSLRTLRHTDPISKRGVPQGSGKESPNGCKSEGQRRKCSPNGLPPFLDDSAVPQPSHTSPVSPLSPCSLATLTHQHSPSWTRSHSVASEGLTESPLRPMSPKPNSPRPAAQRKIFRYPHSSRASSVYPALLGQSVSVEGLTDPPERPKTLKPSTSPLGVSLSPLDAAEHRIDSQSHISLYAIGFINELEGTQNSGRPTSQSRTRKLLEVEGEGKASVVLGGLRTGCWMDMGRNGGGQQRRQNCSDDLWIEEQKRYKRKLARAIRGSLGQLNTLISEDMDKTDAGVTSGPIKAFQGMPLKAHCFSQSTPIGLDCLGWRRRISCASVVIPDGASEKAGLGDELGSEEDLLYEEFRSSGHRFGDPGGGGGATNINEAGATLGIGKVAGEAEEATARAERRRRAALEDESGDSRGGGAVCEVCGGSALRRAGRAAVLRRREEEEARGLMAHDSGSGRWSRQRMGFFSTMLRYTTSPETEGGGVSHHDAAHHHQCGAHVPAGLQWGAHRSRRITLPLFKHTYKHTS
ncbi:uncharacterized protein AKAME5_000748700 [Lates japonicus]|uniref:Uncharacterized protein n=1 Tax=Lates japonicus TaxID=270547 RepID=A0AAD3MHQ2_LATJO|nr:uncharacterized protein AKAME5_000748700 [Lates japonicus]